MSKNEYSTKSTAISIRIPNDLLKEIDELAKIESVDRPTWIKKALLLFADQTNSELEDEAINDFVNLRIDENQLLKYSSLKEIPNDLKEARSEILKIIINKRKKEVNKNKRE